MNILSDGNEISDYDSRDSLNTTYTFPQNIKSEMSMAAPPLPRRTRGGGSGSLFFITVAARQRQLPKKENLKNS